MILPRPLLKGLLLAAIAFGAASAGAAFAEERGATFDANGVTIWYELTGASAGTPLVIVNGGPGFDHQYLHAPAFERLGRNRPVVFYDQRGNGRSSALAPGQPCGLAEQIADLEALRAHLGYERMELLGHSWGGYLVMAYAARFPQRIAHLLIIDSAAPRIQDTAFLFNKIFPETTERQAAVAFDIELGDPAAIQADLDDYFTMVFFDRRNYETFVERAKRDQFDYTPEVNKAVWNDLQRFDLNPELPAFAFPTLVATGRYDFNVAPSVAWAIHRAIPDSDFAVFEKSGHMPQLEEPDAYVARVEEFLAKPAGRVAAKR